MEGCNSEKSKIIPIPQTSPKKEDEGFRYNEYSLKQNFFDPSKSSPPNDFMLKLQLRMSHYESCNNSDNLTKE